MVKSPTKPGKIVRLREEVKPCRINATLPTINYCLERGCSIVLMSHLGRPDGKVVPKFSLKPVSEVLGQLLGKPVTFLDDCVGEKVESVCLAAKPGDVILLENLRFHPEEEGSGVDAEGKKFKPDAESVKKFREQLSKLGEVYINDAFGTAHRAHSSMAGITIPVRAAGLLLAKELNYFECILESPKRPFACVMGGAKIKDKIQIINSMLKQVNTLIIGGGMAYTFLKMSKGMNIGQSLFDEDGSKIVMELLETAKKNNVEVLLPVDFVIVDKFSNDAATKIVTAEEGIPDDMMVIFIEF